MDTDIFITHSENENSLAKKLVKTLSAQMPNASIVCTSLTNHKLPPGILVDEEIARRLVTGAVVQIGIISREALSHQYVVAELAIGYWVANFWRANYEGEKRFPLLLLAPGCDRETTGLEKGPFKGIQTYLWKERDKLIGEVSRLLKYPPSAAPDDKSIVAQIKRQGEWAGLHRVAIQAAAAAGMAAATLYRGHTNEVAQAIRAVPSTRNPSLQADLEATVAAIQVLDGPLRQLSTRLGNLPIAYLAEESLKPQDMKFLRSQLGATADKIASTFEDFSKTAGGIQVMIDGVDGTGSFGRGIPLFCSAVAILIDSKPRVSAIYDPIHHIVYSGHLPGPDSDPTIGAEAWVQELATGNLVDLKKRAESPKVSKLSEEAVGFHLTRTRLDYLKRFFRLGDGWECTILEGISRGSASTYAMNSGIIAMADIARGALGGFVNVVTNLWDVAAGQVLVEACGGKVTRIDGKPINYSVKKAEDAVVDIVAAKRDLYDSLQKIASGSNDAWTQNCFRRDDLEKQTRSSAPKPPNKKIHRPKSKSSG